jgi:hypothetical protein
MNASAALFTADSRCLEWKLIKKTNHQKKGVEKCSKRRDCLLSPHFSVYITSGPLATHTAAAPS